MVSFERNPKLLFKHVNSLRNVKAGITQLATPDGLTHSAGDTANALCDHYHTVYCGRRDTATDTLYFSGHCSEYLTEVDFSASKVHTKLMSLRANSSPGLDGIPPKLLIQLADLVSDPIAECFSRLFHSGVIPDDWKDAVISPIYKGGKRTEPANYRPVALLPVISKVMESVVADELSNHFTQTRQLSSRQHGFRRGYSCATNLLLTRNEDDLGFGVDVIYIDFSKAFDRVNHNLLLQKLYYYGIRNPLLSWINVWLENRRMFVRVSGALSRPISVSCGVPQGSVLGPILFLIFINDLPETVSSRILLFADDAKIWRSIRSPCDRVLLQEDLNKIHSWSVRNLMPLNTEKCSYLPIRSSPYRYTISGFVIPAATDERDLGVIVQSNLGVSLQSKKASKLASAYLSLLRRAFGDFNPSIMKIILNAYIRPHLEYAVQSWSPWLKRDIRTLELVQRRATKMVLGLKHKTYEDRLQSLYLFSVQYRRLRGDMILLYKIFQQPEHPCKSLLRVSNATHLLDIR